VRSFIAVLLVGFGELIVVAEGVGLDVEVGELGPVGEIDRQGRLSVRLTAVLLDQVFDGGQGGGLSLQGLGERPAQEVGPIEREQACQAGRQQGGASMAGKRGVEEALDLGDGEA
jgi:hypothetical protein